MVTRRLRASISARRPALSESDRSSSTSPVVPSVACTIRRLLRSGEDPAPPDRRDKREGPPGARIVAVVDQERAAPDILARQEAPVAPVVRAVAVVPHHEKGVRGYDDRAPVLKIRFVVGRIPLDQVGQLPFPHLDPLDRVFRPGGIGMDHVGLVELLSVSPELAVLHPERFAWHREPLLDYLETF